MVISLVLGIAILWISIKFLNNYTHHGEVIVVPDLANMNLQAIEKKMLECKLRYQVIDSSYDKLMPIGMVIKQDPEKNSLVKQNRIIYLTINSSHPPLVSMPNVVDASLRQAVAMLESYGLKAGKREYKSDPCVNCVLEQIMKGKKIEAGSLIPKGSRIDLVLGKGDNNELIHTPCIIGLSQKEATDIIAGGGFSEGIVVCTDCKTPKDRENAKVYKQNPSCSSETLINAGMSVDIYLSIKSIPTPTENEK